MHCSVRVWGLGFKGLRFTVGFRFEDSEIRSLFSGTIHCTVRLGFGVQGLGFRVQRPSDYRDRSGFVIQSTRTWSNHGFRV